MGPGMGAEIKGELREMDGKLEWVQSAGATAQVSVDVAADAVVWHRDVFETFSLVPGTYRNLMAEVPFFRFDLSIRGTSVHKLLRDFHIVGQHKTSEAATNHEPNYTKATPEVPFSCNAPCKLSGYGHSAMEKNDQAPQPTVFLHKIIK